ncbi:cytochrome b-c1 complex subunit 9, partial [Cryomyces antarcticus]
IASGIYNSIFKRNTVFLATVFLGAFAFEITFDTASSRIWDTINRGRQWKDIKGRYLQHDEE